jgi:hypothetical protein
MTSIIKPFKISVPESDIERLRAKLRHATFPDEVDFSDSWGYGCPLSDVKRLAKYWQDGFDWRAAEARLNEKLPQFTTRISVDDFEELDIHFVHQESPNPGSIPLLFCHGCTFIWFESYSGPKLIKISNHLVETPHMP